jgi:hypothetical protein
MNRGAALFVLAAVAACDDPAPRPAASPATARPAEPSAVTAVEVAPPTGSAAPSDSASSVASSAPPAASAPPTESATPPTPAPPPPYEPMGARIALFVARTTRAAQAVPSPAAPKQPQGAIGGIGNLRTGDNCGGIAPLTVHQNTVAPPKTAVEIGLAPKPGLPPKDAAEAARNFGTLRARTASCVRSEINRDPSLQSVKLSVEVRADGASPPAVTFEKPVQSATLEACFRRSIQIGLGGDTTAASIVFPIWIDIGDARAR